MNSWIKLYEYSAEQIQFGSLPLLCFYPYNWEIHLTTHGTVTLFTNCATKLMKKTHNDSHINQNSFPLAFLNSLLLNAFSITLMQAYVWLCVCVPLLYSKFSPNSHRTIENLFQSIQCKSYKNFQLSRVWLDKEKGKNVNF